MKKESRRSKEKKRKERNKGPNSVYLHNFFFSCFLTILERLWFGRRENNYGVFGYRLFCLN